MTRRRGWSDITVTDQFCGAGGSSIGAAKAGLRVRMAMNHWKLAVETHNTNFPETDHDCCDISASDPRRYPSTDILITSPECTTHSPAGGNRRRQTTQSDLFLPTVNDPTVERSRATMWDVPRFAEFHRYRRIIVENVVEVLRWELFDVWLKAMHTLGYRHKIVSLNSMFCWPTPQSRDRVYINFWRKGDAAPDLELRPKAPCARCGIVEALQTWKNGRTVGKYRTQYVFTCPTCRAVVLPFYYAALNAIDFSIAAERIGDRTRPLKERTLERIRFGLEKYGRRPLLVRTIHGERLFCRVRDAEAEPFDTQPGSSITGFVSPFIIDCAHAYDNHPGALPVDAPHASQTARQSNALVSPFIVEAANGAERARRVRGLDEEFSTVHAGGGNHALVTPFVITERTNNKGNAIDDALPTVCAGTIHHALIQGAAQLSMRDANAMRIAGLERELMAQGCAPQQAIVSRSPFIVNNYGQSTASDATDPMGTTSTRVHHGIATPGEDPRVEDCYFRMLQPQEIGAAMAFPDTYVVHGNKRDRVKQYGNAVTPPVMETLIERNVQSLTGDRAA